MRFLMRRLDHQSAMLVLLAGISFLMCVFVQGAERITMLEVGAIFVLLLTLKLAGASKAFEEMAEDSRERSNQCTQFSFQPSATGHSQKSCSSKSLESITAS